MTILKESFILYTLSYTVQYNNENTCLDYLEEQVKYESKIFFNYSYKGSSKLLQVLVEIQLRNISTLNLHPPFQEQYHNLPCKSRTFLFNSFFETKTQITNSHFQFHSGYKLSFPCAEIACCTARCFAAQSLQKFQRHFALRRCPRIICIASVGIEINLNPLRSLSTAAA